MPKKYIELNQKNLISEQNKDIGQDPDVMCICPICGYKFHQEPGKPCYYKNCPKCGMIMTNGE